MRLVHVPGGGDETIGWVIFRMVNGWRGCFGRNGSCLGAPSDVRPGCRPRRRGSAGVGRQEFASTDASCFGGFASKQPIHWRRHRFRCLLSSFRGSRWGRLAHKTSSAGSGRARHQITFPAKSNSSISITFIGHRNSIDVVSQHGVLGLSMLVIERRRREWRVADLHVLVPEVPDLGEVVHLVVETEVDAVPDVHVAWGVRVAVLQRLAGLAAPSLRGVAPRLWQRHVVRRWVELRRRLGGRQIPGCHIDERRQNLQRRGGRPIDERRYRRGTLMITSGAAGAETYGGSLPGRGNRRACRRSRRRRGGRARGLAPLQRLAGRDQGLALDRGEVLPPPPAPDNPAPQAAKTILMACEQVAVGGDRPNDIVET